MPITADQEIRLLRGIVAKLRLVLTDVQRQEFSQSLTDFQLEAYGAGGRAVERDTYRWNKMGRRWPSFCR